MYPWFPKILQCSLKLDSPGKIKLGLSSTKFINVLVADKLISEVSDTLTLDLPSGLTPISIVIGREAVDLKGFKVEILDGAAQVSNF